ncbi:hypothetical protein DID80_06250 [Candidatus Marinamargulisbacteria bacterium SCGC AAA071-K20]|nr:hypothetical protein DID80_06250 [Candidatus Marinamargulisbacteria bacterium SCGC AAA071-K20]
MEVGVRSPLTKQVNTTNTTVSSRQPSRRRKFGDPSLHATERVTRNKRSRTDQEPVSPLNRSRFMPDPSAFDPSSPRTGAAAGAGTYSHTNPAPSAFDYGAYSPPRLSAASAPSPTPSNGGYSPPRRLSAAAAPPPAPSRISTHTLTPASTEATIAAYTSNHITSTIFDSIDTAEVLVPLDGGDQYAVYDLPGDRVAKLKKGPLYGNRLIDRLMEEEEWRTGALGNFRTAPIEIKIINIERTFIAHHVTAPTLDIHPVIVQNKGTTFLQHLKSIESAEHKQGELDSLFKNLFDTVIENVKTGKVHGYDLAPKNVIEYTDPEGITDWALCDFGIQDDDEADNAAIHVTKTINENWKDVTLETKQEYCQNFLVEAVKFCETTTDLETKDRVRIFAKGFSTSLSNQIHGITILDEAHRVHPETGIDLVDYFNPPRVTGHKRPRTEAVSVNPFEVPLGLSLRLN